MRWRFTRLAPLAAVCAAGCFATRNDVRVVQANVLSLQAQVAQLIAAQQAEVRRQIAQTSQTDSLRSAEMRRALATLSVLSDSVAALSDGLSRDRANTAASFREIDERLTAFMQIAAASSRAMRDALADVEARRAAAPPSEGAGDSANAPAAPGPRALYQSGRAQFLKQGYGAAREFMQELMTKYPNADEASGALLLIGQTYAAEDKEVEADSVYASVVKRFPQSDAAPSALFKRAEALAKNGQPAKARELYKQIVDEYKDSNEAPLARERIKPAPAL